MEEWNVTECSHYGRMQCHGVFPLWKNALSRSVPMMVDCTVMESIHDGRIHCNGVCQLWKNAMSRSVPIMEECHVRDCT